MNTKGAEGTAERSAAGPPGSNALHSWRVDASLSVARYMKQEVSYLRENMWVDAAASFLVEHGLRDAPVLDGEGRPVGVLYVDDVTSEEEFVDLERDEQRLDGRDDDGDSFESVLLRDYGLGAGFHLNAGRRLRVREVMVPYVPEISAESSVATAALVMHDNQLDHVIVVGDDGRAVGTFSREEMVRWLVDQTSGRESLSSGSDRVLRDVMRPAITVRRRASLLTARDMLTTHDRQELPVLDGGQVVGVVTEGEIYSMIAAHRDDDGWMQELLVEDVMKPPMNVRGPEDTLESIRPVLKASDSYVLVEQDGRLLGVVSARDFGVGAGEPAPPSATARSHVRY